MVNFTAGSVLTASALNTAFNTQTIDAQTGTTFTFGTANSGELVTLSNASGGTATIPPNSTYGAATGTVIGVMNAGTAGSFVIAAGSGVTLNAVSGTTTLAPLEAATLVKLATNTWQLTKGGGLPKASYSGTTGSPTVTTVGGKSYITFTGDGSITVTDGVLAVYVLAGGGSGGFTTTAGPGGGGAGGLMYSDYFELGAGTHTVKVGAGAAGKTAEGAGNDGGFSRIGTVYCVGGGHGEAANVTTNSGGCGGGGYGGSAVSNAGGSGLQNFDGGSGFHSATTSLRAGGGGGGTGAVGSNAASNAAGAGGAGASVSGFDSGGGSIQYGGGGGGASPTDGSGAAGAGGGTAGVSSGASSNAAANSGGGSGGSSGTASGNGGSGRVIVVIG
jgi:hypothetical protein